MNVWARDGVSDTILNIASIEPEIRLAVCLRCSPEAIGELAVSMSLVLTSPPPRPLVIDLTETPPPSPPPLDHFAIANGNGNEQQQLPLPQVIPRVLSQVQRQQHDPPQDEGPPLKRRRVDLAWAEKRNIACQQVSPYVSQALRDLPASEYIIDEIAIRVCKISSVGPS